jgi:heme A synthase
MSKLTRTLLVGATLAAINLAGMTTVAHAYPLDPATDEPTRHDARRPPTQGQVGEAWHQHPVTSQQQIQATAADATLGRVLAREHFSIPNQPSAQVPAPVPAQPNGQRGWLLASLGVLAAALLLAGGVAVLAARRASRRAPPRPASLPR